MSKNSIKGKTVRDTSGRMYFVKTDSGVLQAGNREGYSRTMVLAGWDEDDRDRIMKADIHIDRMPEKSHARAWVWTDTAGWADMGSLPTDAYWEALPGYARAASPGAVRETARLAGDLATVCYRLHQDGAI